MPHSLENIVLTPHPKKKKYLLLLMTLVDNSKILWKDINQMHQKYN
jgi:hypothetical protein